MGLALRILLSRIQRGSGGDAAPLGVWLVNGHEMNKLEFAEEIKRFVKDDLGEAYEVGLREVTKNNDVTLIGVTLTDKCSQVAPTIYLDELYKDYQNGRSVEGIAALVISSLRKGMPKQRVHMEFFTEFDNVKDQICYRLIHYGRNEKLLEKIPNLPFLDLAITFFYPFHHEEIGYGSIQITNEHIKRWGVNVKDLWRVANENTQRLFPQQCCPMGDILMELTGMIKGEEWPELPTEEDMEHFLPMMRVLTNRQRTFGASVILYDHYLERLSDSFGQSLYLIPSSIHEVIVMPVKEGADEIGLQDMIKEVNKEVPPTDVLSDRLYYYDRASKTIKMACERALQGA